MADSGQSSSSINTRPSVKYNKSFQTSTDDNDVIQQSTLDRPLYAPTVSFQYNDDPESAYHSQLNNGADFKRKRSLVRPERERPNSNHRLFHYRNRAAQLDVSGNVGVQPSCMLTQTLI